MQHQFSTEESYRAFSAIKNSTDLFNICDEVYGQLIRDCKSIEKFSTADVKDANMAKRLEFTMRLRETFTALTRCYWLGTLNNYFEAEVARFLRLTGSSWRINYIQVANALLPLIDPVNFLAATSETDDHKRRNEQLAAIFAAFTPKSVDPTKLMNPNICDDCPSRDTCEDRGNPDTHAAKDLSK
jgi:hypothetical protein